MIDFIKISEIEVDLWSILPKIPEFQKPFKGTKYLLNLNLKF